MPGDFVNFLEVPVDQNSEANALIPALMRGMQLSNMPQQMNADLKSKQLKNALAQIQLKYADPKAQAEIAAKQALAPYYQAMISKINNAEAEPLSTFGKLQSDYNNAVKNFGENSPQAQQLKQALQLALQGKQGITVFDPKTGSPLVNVGGSPGSSRGGGGTYVNPETGEITSKPTTAQNTQLQRGLMGEKNLEQFMDQYISVLPQFQSPTVKVKSLLEGLSNKFLGSNYELPSQEAYGQASLVTATEGLLKSLGLHATGENLNTVKGILKPKFGESAQGFKNRALRQLQQFTAVKNRLENQLASGYSVGNSNSPYAMTPEQISRYHQLLGGQIGQSILPNSKSISSNGKTNATNPSNSKIKRSRYNPATGKIEPISEGEG